MADFWQIKGQAGAGLDATLRDCSALGVFGGKITYPALATDTFTFSLLLANLDGSGQIIPDNGQTIELWRNGSKFFFGPCLVTQQGYVVNVEVRGAWFWLESMPLTQDQTDAKGNTAPRLQYAFKGASAGTFLTSGTMLNALLNRLITLGCPISIGVLENGFEWPEITLNQSTAGEAVAELVRLTPDMMAYWDYSGTTPAFNTRRRSSPGTTVITLDASDIDPAFSVQPIVQLQVQYASVQYMSRAIEGYPIFQQQLSGIVGTCPSAGTSTTIALASTASSVNDAYTGLLCIITSGTGAGQASKVTAYNGTTKVATVSPAWTTAPSATSHYQIGFDQPISKVQVLPVSGYELDTWLPNDLFDTVTVKTNGPTTTGAAMDAFVFAKDQVLADLLARYGSFATNGLTTVPTVVNGGSFGVFSGTATSHTAGGNVSFAPITYTDRTSGAVISTTGKYLVVVGDLPDWFTDIAPTGGTVTIKQATLNATYYSKVSGADDAAASTNSTQWFKDLAVASGSVLYKGYSASGSGGGWYQTVLRRTAIDVSLISATAPLPPSFPYTGSTAVYKPQDYAFRYPPTGFAENLRIAQNFTPYQGTFSITQQEAGGTRFTGCCINLTGILPQYATMRALVSNVEIDIDAGTTTVTLGQPERLNYQDLVNRVRRTSTDNIVYLKK